MHCIMYKYIMFYVIIGDRGTNLMIYQNGHTIFIQYSRFKWKLLFVYHGIWVSQSDKYVLKYFIHVSCDTIRTLAQSPWQTTRQYNNKNEYTIHSASYSLALHFIHWAWKCWVIGSLNVYAVRCWSAF